ncbi:hypothetical protein [Panacagrimonas perspica]|nr:hypothetical protein [Panacagrimonas perspica]
MLEATSLFGMRPGFEIASIDGRPVEARGPVVAKVGAAKCMRE